MNRYLCVLLLCVGCNGDEDTDDTAALPACFPVSPTIEITVVDPDGNFIEGASVKWDNVACTEAGAGIYNCTATPGGANQLSVIATNMRAFSEFLTDVPAANCIPAAYTKEVVLEPGIAR